jgi:hypothetical protein
MVQAVLRQGLVGRFTLFVVLAACVSSPEATRTGGTACTRDDMCNAGPLCGAISVCVDGFCSEDPVFRVCDDGAYGGASPVVECTLYAQCNTMNCGALVPCIAGRCDTSAPRLAVPCDAGSD